MIVLKRTYKFPSARQIFYNFHLQTEYLFSKFYLPSLSPTLVICNDFLVSKHVYLNAVFCSIKPELDDYKPLCLSSGFLVYSLAASFKFSCFIGNQLYVLTLVVPQTFISQN